MANIVLILYLDDECVVINKVPGEAAEGVSPGMSGTVDVGVSPMSRAVDVGGVLARQIPLVGGFLPRAVHRLDVPVSGCLLFARTPGALAFLSGVFAQGLTGSVPWNGSGNAGDSYSRTGGTHSLDSLESPDQQKRCV